MSLLLKISDVFSKTLVKQYVQEVGERSLSTGSIKKKIKITINNFLANFEGIESV